MGGEGKEAQCWGVHRGGQDDFCFPPAADAIPQSVFTIMAGLSGPVAWAQTFFSTCTGWVLGFFMTREVVCIRLPAVSLRPGRDVHPVSWLPASPRHSMSSSTWAHLHANLQEFCGLRSLLHTSPDLLLVLMMWGLLNREPLVGPFPVRVCQFS